LIKKVGYTLRIGQGSLHTKKRPDQAQDSNAMYAERDRFALKPTVTEAIPINPPCKEELPLKPPVNLTVDAGWGSAKFFKKLGFLPDTSYQDFRANIATMRPCHKNATEIGENRLTPSLKTNVKLDEMPTGNPITYLNNLQQENLHEPI